jgi:hypothetical protein
MTRISQWSAVTVLALAPLVASAQTPVLSPSPPCAPPVVANVAPAPVVAAVPVTVTTRRYGLFGLRTRTTVTYGAPAAIPVPATVESYSFPAPAPVLRVANGPVVVSP